MRQLFLAVVIAGAALAVTSEAHAQAPRLGGRQSPACELLGTDEIRKITGRQEYGPGSTGDEPGEGLGGGTSCQWDRQGIVGEAVPTVSVILVPKGTGQRYVERRKQQKPRPGCKLEPVAGVGEEAFFELCEKAPALPLFVRGTGANDLVVAMQVRPPLDPGSAKPTVVALAKAAFAKMR